MRPNWIKFAVALGACWLVIGVLVVWVRGKKPTPERVAAYVRANPLEGRAPGERAKVIENVAEQVNRIDFEQRREMDRRRDIEPFWVSLTPEERTHYLELVLPKGFRQMMENFNKMEPARRRKLVQRAVEDLRSRSGEQPPREISEAQLKKIVNEGLKAFYSDATIEAKMDALPFLEQLEQTVKWAH